jgi:signal transduction histidine kinase
LLENAAKYTPPGAPISINARQSDGAISVRVADAGPGIPAAHLPHLFDRYYRVHARPTGGTGLGLAISKGIGAAHGGHIAVESRPGQGTTFTFTLPLAPPMAPLTETPAAGFPQSTEVNV